jgi:hypothetical protein
LLALKNAISIPEKKAQARRQKATITQSEENTTSGNVADRTKLLAGGGSGMKNKLNKKKRIKLS